MKKTNTKTIKDSDKIVVKSLKPNVYYTCPKTMDTFIWAEVGEVQSMTFAQIKLMKNKHKGYFTNRIIRPENETVLDSLNIRSYYEDKFDRKDFSLLRSDDIKAIKNRLQYIKKDEIDMIKDKIIKMISSGMIENIHVIRLLENFFNTKFI